MAMPANIKRLVDLHIDVPLKTIALTYDIDIADLISLWGEADIPWNDVENRLKYMHLSINAMHELRTLCNESGLSCRNSDGQYKSYSELQTITGHQPLHHEAQHRDNNDSEETPSPSSRCWYNTPEGCVANYDWSTGPGYMIDGYTANQPCTHKICRERKKAMESFCKSPVKMVLSSTRPSPPPVNDSKCWYYTPTGCKNEPWRNTDDYIVDEWGAESYVYGTDKFCDARKKNVRSRCGDDNVVYVASKTKPKGCGGGARKIEHEPMYYVVQLRALKSLPNAVCNASDTFNGVLDWNCYDSLDHAIMIYKNLTAGSNHLTAIIKRKKRVPDEFDNPIKQSNSNSYMNYKNSFATQIMYKEKYYNLSHSFKNHKTYIVQLRATHTPADDPCIAKDVGYNGILDWNYQSVEDAVIEFSNIKTIGGGQHATAIIIRTTNTDADFDNPLKTSHGLANYNNWKEMFKQHILYKESFLFP